MAVFRLVAALNQMGSAFKKYNPYASLLRSKWGNRIVRYRFKIDVLPSTSTVARSQIVDTVVKRIKMKATASAKAKLLISFASASAPPLKWALMGRYVSRRMVVNVAVVMMR